jgi:hypothetical protein
MTIEILTLLLASLAGMIIGTIIMMINYGALRRLTLRDPVAEEPSPPCAAFDPERCHWCKITDGDYHPLP